MKRRQDEAQFRASLLAALRKSRSRDIFRLSEFATKCGIAKEAADRVAEDVYGAFCKNILADGVITPNERESASWLATALELDDSRSGLIERRVKEDKYKQAVSGVLADGAVTVEEAAHLEQLRQHLAFSKGEAFRLTHDVSRSAYLAAFRRVVRDGAVTTAEEQELLRWKQALAVSDEQANDIIRVEALALYRQHFLSVIQDGIVTPDEERRLAWLQRWAGLREVDVAPYHQRIREIKRLAAYRQGSLPLVKTRLILEGGETCHWDRQCTLAYQTRTRQQYAIGSLVVTSKNVYFVSHQKSVSYRPSRILDIIRHSNGLEIKTSARQGSGHYLTSDAEELEAILIGVVSKHKFLLSESYSSTKARHIPDEVKREVWDRDGGRCARCSAAEYLEFDHIIPHSRGGANSANNVQLLCRKCNLLKSDRI